MCTLPGDNDNPCSMFGTGIGYKGIESAAIALVVIISFLASCFLFFWFVVWKPLSVQSNIDLILTLYLCTYVHTFNK